MKSRFQFNAIVRALFASGGLPARAWSVPGKMQVGINTGLTGYYSARRFANVLYDMAAWAPVTSGGGVRTPGTWSQFQGTLNGDGDGSGTDGKYFRAPIASTAYGMPGGVYTVFNPSGQEFGIGQFGNQTNVAFTTAKYVTFTYTPSSSGLYLWCRRSLQNTGAGNLQVILPGCVGNGTVDTTNGTYLTNGATGITSGNPWNPDFLTFSSGLSVQHMRWMTTLRVIGSVERDWSDRVQPTSIAFTSHLGTGNAIPYELVIDFANRMGIDPWTNIPPQATDAFITSCASLHASLLNANRRVLAEYSNEAWNYASAYLDGTKFVNYLQYTKYFATVSDASNPGAPVFLAPAHGRTVGDSLVLLATRENAFLGTNSIYFMQQGYTYTVSATDTNHFTLDLASAGRSLPTGLVNIQYCWAAEPGKSSSGSAPDVNYSTRQLAIWDAFDSALGVGRVVHSCASQAANSNVTGNRISVGAMPSRAEHVHTAPYYSGLYWRVAFTGGGSKITPSCWASVGGTIYYGIYAAGSTPSNLDVVRGTGAGFIAGSTQSVSSMTATTGTAVTGLTDGTNYAAFAVFQESKTGYFWKIGTGTDSLNPTNVLSTVAAGAQPCFDTFANQATRCRLDSVSTSKDAAHQAAIAAAGSSATLITYEGGPDFNGANCPAELTAWLLTNYFPSAAHVGTFTHSLNHLARVGFRSHSFFIDIAGLNSGVTAVGDAWLYDLVPNTLYTATAVDGRYAAMAAFGGTVNAQAAFPGTLTANRLATPITSVPGGFPYTVYAGLPGGYTYSIVSGDWTSNFAISGTNVVMANATGLNFTGYSPELLTIEASDGFSSTSFTLLVPIGSAWYESDAQFVWDSVGAAAGTSMTPPSNLPFISYGSALVEIAGTGNPVITSSSGTVSNDLWKMATYVFAGTNGMQANIPTNVPFLVAHVVDVGDQTTTFQYQLGIGAASNSISYGVGSSITNSRWRLVVAGTTLFSGLADCASNPAKGTKSLKWMYVDPVNGTAIAGVNQTPYVAGALSGLTISNTTLGPDVRIGTANGGSSSQSQMYHGSVQVLARAGLTQTQALAIVQNMQTHHGI